MTITPVNSITIPREYVHASDGWYSDGGDLLYAIYSTGGLTTGTNRALRCDTDEQWYLMLWHYLSIDIGVARRAADQARHKGWEGGEDHAILCEFEDWVDAICERLAEEYNLEDWAETI